MRYIWRIIERLALGLDSIREAIRRFIKRHVELVLGTAILAFLLLMALLIAVPAQAHGQYSSTAEFVNSHILEPRGSVLDGHQLINNWRWYGIPVRSQLVIIGAETALATYPAGGRLVPQANNFGCIRASSGYQSTPWGEWASGTIVVGGKRWLAWPSVEKGIHGWGRYMKTGVNGAYQSMVFGPNPDWSRFAYIYFGAGVPGIGHYIGNLRSIDHEFTSMAREHGFVW